MTYTVVFVRERDGGCCVHIPALPGCHTQGNDLPEALEMAKDAILCHLEALEADGEAAPPDVVPVAVDLGDGVDAMVLRVTVRETAAVASAAGRVRA